MSDLEKPVALFIPSDDYDSRFFDGNAIPFDPLSDLEPVPKRPRTTDRGEYLEFIIAPIFSINTQTSTSSESLISEFLF